MFSRYRLSDGSELQVHKAGDALVLANVNKQGVTTWAQRLEPGQATELKNFLASQGF